MNNLKYWYMVVCMSIITLGFGVSMYQNYYPIKIIEIHTPLKVKTPIVRAGSVMIYIADYCQYRLYPVTVARTLLDGTSIPLPIVNGIGQLGCHTAEVQVSVPLGSLPGIYYLQGIAKYQVNAQRIENVPFNTEPFQIVK